MKILLINSPIRLSAKPNCIPYGLAVIASVLRQKGHKVILYDINGYRHSDDEIRTELSKMDWDIVGVSGLITTYSFQRWIIHELKQFKPEAPVISGGGLATTNYQLVLTKTEADIAVIGEGEKTMDELVDTIEDKSPLSGVKGLAFKHSGKVIVTEKRENITCLDKLPFPAWDLLPMDIYLGNIIWGDIAGNSSGFNKDVVIKKSMNIISSRGCPFSCNYCYNLFGRSNYRTRSADNILAEMESLIERYNVDFFGFVDDNMMVSEKRILEFCDKLMDKKWNITWGCHGRVGSAKPEILKKMSESGCVWIGFGIESGSQSILDAMNKRSTVEQAKEAIINTREAGIYPNTTFIFGYPGETKHTIEETITFKKEMDLDCSSFFVTPYPGTELYSKYKDLIDDEETYIEKLADATKFVVNLTDFDDKEFLSLKKKYDNE